VARETYSLGGRRYESVGVSTIEHDIWFRAQRRKAGLLEIVQREDETAEECVARFVDDAFERREVFTLLGGLLVPEGTEPGAWTPALAEETGRALKGLQDEGEKVLVRVVFLSAMLGFFASGEISFRGSRSSSTATTMTNPATAPLIRTNGMEVGAP
jgi:hypothetical protein